MKYKYNPRDDILRFRDFQPPWVWVDCPERLLEGISIKPIAFNARDRLVLLLTKKGACPLSLCRSDSPEGEYGEDLAGYETIWHFEDSWQLDVGCS